MILAGGTGGHIFPGLAVAKALAERGVPVVWLGGDGGMETRLVPPHGIAIETIGVSGARGKGTAKLLALPFKLLGAVRAAGAILRKHRPRAVLSFGGYAAGPGGLAARLAGIPLLVHEQNRAPGLTNRVLSKLAGTVMTGFPGTFAGERVLGNPVRADIAALPARDAPPDRPLRLLVIGGSQGARALNLALPRALAKFSPAEFSIRHQCGEKMLDETRRAYAEADLDVRPEAFIADMAAAYRAADLLICRAGALTLAEVCAAGVASLLVPFPQAVDDHQTRNAEYLAERGAARLVRQSDALAADLERELATLAANPARLQAMGRAAKALAKPDAAERVADAVLEAARK
ncbi:undecaprenyldiphospho-muramoylpentapeptide beta-N-acetylglucosaminyltransferase [Lysobacter pythonis]|uniref:UDP-N-acetylglucosamine--N-acetylmuramyl-(pentapeptide) pyrophosphoryl-undecaprenol N-acetylglucosamine transferase n=1 Tax=Solilutibacter pythonis TaxID=2483112 RepID=A0A3M2HWX8_9GAMM|nr:undecaprenyldiphospho-muramoylpentapeptide beta-N-acetylglucosaminyltransferase [Lysobacter pythonis]